MKRIYLILALLVVLVLSSCMLFKNDPPLISLHSTVTEGQEIAPKTMVSFSWSVLDSADDPLTVKFTLKKDGEVILEEAGINEKTVAIEEEGHYTVVITANDGKNVTTEELNFKATNLVTELYQSDSGLIYLDRNQWFDYAEDAEGDILIRFYKAEVDETGEGTYTRIRLNLVDTDGDGLGDAWEEIPNDRPDLQDWISCPATLTAYDTTWQFYQLMYGEDFIRCRYYGTSGTYQGYVLVDTLAEVGFELGVPYSRYIYMDTPYGPIGDYKGFMLRERYDSDSKPVFSIEATPTSVSTGATFTVKVVGKNVADFAKLYDTRYMQLSLWKDSGITLESVDFSDFMDGFADVSAYNVNDNSVTLYKGFTVDKDEPEEASDVFAVLTFKVNDDFDGSEISLGLAYEGWWTGYGDYVDLPNPIFRDKDNKALDGFVIDYVPVTVSVESAD
ncbi:hypothetical protein [Kosmotoga olearia]|uniref:Uncharacterized protein n=1 Tax=Kosmotoga olearia (strain ATCC BAA-1733 / DSM 21960 / TBF 19.5.1) TaxID=521045 RepID=C5CI22_KOSOT|nr:hypothetical protein [Kosmotoga olearia]ACR79801.1 hypothetical protein Kole_1099 [Kosmotoga olearia TBF 19.5.1]